MIIEVPFERMAYAASAHVKVTRRSEPKPKRYEVHDVYCPGMSVRVSAQGQKVFTVKFRYGLAQKRMTLGIYPRISLATAREKAIDILRQVDEGIDPTKRRRTANMKVESVCREFIRLHAQPRNKSGREAERILERARDRIPGHVGPFDLAHLRHYPVPLMRT